VGWGCGVGVCVGAGWKCGSAMYVEGVVGVVGGGGVGRVRVWHGVLLETKRPTVWRALGGGVVRGVG